MSRTSGKVASGLLNAIRAKRIDRIAAFYAVAAWFLVQSASIALPAFSAPGWVLRVIIGICLAGFPTVIAGAWITSPRGSSKTAPRETRLIDAVLALLLGAIVVFAGVKTIKDRHWLFGIPAGSTGLPEVAGIAQTGMPASVAVLPFQNLTSNVANRLFGEGIAAELISQLSQVEGLRVVARASSFSFEGKSVDIRTISRLLNVRAVLDGSVRVEGTQVRIEAELSRDDGFTIWSRTYEGDLSHILALQDEIASAIGQALTHRLVGGQALAATHPATIAPDAFREYLQGKYQLAKRTEDSVADARRHFLNVTRLQPDFAAGFAALARSASVEVFNFGHRELMPEGEAAVQKARAIDPGNVDALIVHSALSLAKWDWKNAAADLRKTLQLPSANSETLNSEALLYRYLGFPDRSLASAKAAVDLDPLFPIAWANAASSFFEAGKYKQAAEAAGNALALLPDHPDILVEQCGAYAHSNRLREAEAVAALLTAAGKSAHANGCLFEIDLAQGQIPAARRIADMLARTPETDLPRLRESLGQYYLLTGDQAKAFDHFEQDYDRRQLGFFTVPFDHSTPKGLLAGARWRALMQKPLLHDWTAVHAEMERELLERRL